MPTNRLSAHYIFPKTKLLQWIPRFSPSHEPGQRSNAPPAGLCLGSVDFPLCSLRFPLWKSYHLGYQMFYFQSAHMPKLQHCNHQSILVQVPWHMCHRHCPARYQQGIHDRICSCALWLEWFPCFHWTQRKSFNCWLSISESWVWL